MTRITRMAAALIITMAPVAAQAQINFQKTGYYVAMGDSVAAGEGAMPVTRGYAQEGLLLVERRGGYTGGLDFDVHPTNSGHTFIAAQFAEAWRRLQ